ncbi:helix-turn-helix transcriptional regulator [Streptomyces sp. NPDC049881]|uniref:helix-turn-helix domain-containing protein n=1 Tax=Streptomyces sp. NPDC049881 TaxID=3155778 RepID=UPI00343D9467
MSSTPTVRRRRLGAKLRDLRDGHGWTLEDAVARLRDRGVSLTVAKLSRLETARSAAKPADVEALLDLYGADDAELRSALLLLTREGARRGWWHSYRSVLSPVYEDLISLEADATSIRSWQLAVIPGLLQTAEYARGIISATAMSEAVAAKVDALVEVRLARQAVLTREDPVKLWTIIHENALRVRGADGVMAEQLSRLLTLSRRPNITVQILPADAPLHVGQTGAYSILSFDDHADLDVVHVEALASALYVEGRQSVSIHRDAFERLRAAALSVEESELRIAKIREEL